MERLVKVLLGGGFLIGIWKVGGFWFCKEWGKGSIFVRGSIVSYCESIEYMWKEWLNLIGV